MKFIFFFIILVSVFIIGCSKEENTQQKVKNQTEEFEIAEDIISTPEEKFSASILEDFLAETEDDDLASFLESEIYRQSANFNGAAVVEVTPSTWLISLEKDGKVKNYMLQKYVDFKTNEYYFTLKETSVSITDVISRTKQILPAGE